MNNPPKVWYDETVDGVVGEAMLRSRFSGGAVISECGAYRYALWRLWEPLKIRPTIVNFLMLNPSTADAENDDATIRKCVQFAKRWGYDGILVTNLFGFRATDPWDLKKVHMPVGGLNNSYIGVAARNCDKVICAWGNHGCYLNRSETVRHQLRLEFPGKAFSIGPLTKSAEPKHPLYIKYETELLPMP